MFCKCHEFINIILYFGGAHDNILQLDLTLPFCKKIKLSDISFYFYTLSGFYF